jgi:type II secretory pathway component PulK
MEELAVFPFLSALQIEQFIQYRKFTGKLLDTRELQAVPGWSAVIVRRIIPFVTVHEMPSLQSTLAEDLRKGKQQVLLRSALSKKGINV